MTFSGVAAPKSLDSWHLLLRARLCTGCWDGNTAMNSMNPTQRDLNKTSKEQQVTDKLSQQDEDRWQ